MMRNLPLLALGLSVALLLGLLLLWNAVPDPNTQQSDTPPTLQSAVIVHAAAALRTPMEAAREQFTAETGVAIELRFGSSEALLSQLELTQQGDLFLPADASYIDMARSKGLVEQTQELATMHGVAVFRSDFPKDAKEITWADLVAPGFRLSQPGPSTAIGKLTESALKPSGRWSQLQALKPSGTGTITESANAVKLGSVDGAIIFDAVAKQYPTLKVVHLPELAGIRAKVTIGVCKNAVMRAEARWFAQYLADDKLGQVHFRNAGYGAAEESATPALSRDDSKEILLYAGSMLRPAIEETITEFEKREGVRVTRVYNGCGILVGHMKAGKNPDLYFACDERFMGEVEDRFLKPKVLSNNQLVIATHKGNPFKVKELKDLGIDNLRVGVGHEQQCAMGAITKETFIKSGVYAAVRKNVKVESPTGDLLVNQLMTKSLDAVVCYISNVKPFADQLDYQPIQGLPCSAPNQPIAIAKGSTNQVLAAKLIEAIEAKASQERFAKLGFGWGPGEPKK